MAGAVVFNTAVLGPIVLRIRTRSMVRHLAPTVLKILEYKGKASRLLKLVIYEMFSSFYYHKASTECLRHHSVHQTRQKNAVSVSRV
jgi:hypothetical protein